jgi:exodeoxyribonuclease V alpha subunit
MNELVELRGTIEKILFKSPENGFSVFRLQINAKESIVARGSLPALQSGEEVSLQGAWTFHPKFGRQFEVAHCYASLPSSMQGIKKYLGSGLIKGIGPAYAERIINAFGSKALEIIDKEPDRLCQVEGIGKQRIASIVEAWKEQKEVSRVMVFLQERNVSPVFASKIFKTYGHESIAKIQENPYRLAEDIWGVGFKTADGVALKLGFDKLSNYRIKAAILYSLKELSTSGHLYGIVSEIKAKVAEILELESEHLDLLKRALEELYSEEKIKLITHNTLHYLALPSFYFSEKGIAAKIKKLKEPELAPRTFNYSEIYTQLSTSESKIQLNDDQIKGILSSLQNKLSIITGGPGTGKTTLIRSLLEILDRYHCRVRLAAPTGRAAKRIFEGTGRNAETLHRLLEFTPQSMAFSRNEQNAIETDFLIIDEASMIDVFLMHSILKAMPQKAHLILIGDVDQLPSVGAGNILNDLIASKEVATTRLTQIFRQAQDSLIIVNAHRINNGEFPIMKGTGPKRDFRFIAQKEVDEVFGALKTIYTSTLAKAGISTQDAIVLCPMNRGIAGTQRINQELQNLLNPSAGDEHYVDRFGRTYRVNDRVMQIRNNYNKFVFNGDMGFVSSINRIDQNMKVKFGERELDYDFSELDELELSYAISIHKSQGSEFKAVIIPLFMQHFIMLQRNLIYTALTRAKQLCIVVGQAKALAMGIKNNKGVVRTTFLKEFLTSELEAR